MVWEGRVYSEASSLVLQEATVSLRLHMACSWRSVYPGRGVCVCVCVCVCERERERERERESERMRGLLRVRLKCLIRTLNPVGSGLPPMISFSLNYSLRGLISKYSHTGG